MGRPMRLYEYKAKIISALSNYDPKNDREKELIERLIIKVHNLRNMTMPDWLMTLHLIQKERDVSDEFKKLVQGLMLKPEELSEIFK